MKNEPKTAGRGNGSTAAVWLRALELTAPIRQNPLRTLPSVIDEQAARLGEAPALLSDLECLTYRELAERSNRYARWALAQNLAKGETVCLLMANRPEYLAIWLGITKVGGVVALLNTHLAGSSLAHCMNIVKPRHVIVASEWIDPLSNALPQVTGSPTIWIHGAGAGWYPGIDEDIHERSGEELADGEWKRPSIEDRALYIYTSGTTGLPKAASVSHGRLMQWSYWFAGLMGTSPADRMYDCLPMYHSVGGVQAPGAVLAGGGSVVIREKFSAREFWSDIRRWDCTMFQYIGELCRYLLQGKTMPEERAHRIRLACGNGLRPDIWDEFKRRFGIGQVLEFYAATEGVVSLFNVENESGAIGRIPGYLKHRFPVTLARFDVETDEPIRNAEGFCEPCAANEPGEALGPLRGEVASRFEGYAGAGGSEQRILRDVFEPGDAWFRTGDLMRRDERGFFYFVDRIGDTFRWKGENVATFEVAEAICRFPGVREATVYGVGIPGADGRAGMAAIVAEENLDMAGLRAHLARSLPEYARPMFVRIRSGMEVTGTFKYSKVQLMREGYDPACGDAVFFNDGQLGFVRVDQALYEQIGGARECAHAIAGAGEDRMHAV